MCQWANDLDDEVRKSPPSETPKIRAKQVVLLQHAILVLAGGSGDLAGSDVSSLILMVAKARNLFTGDERYNEIRYNNTEVKYVLCTKSEDILQAARRTPSMMTDAFRSVVQRCPSSLDWRPWTPGSNDTQCFEAIGDDGCIYSINLISGDLLVNGLPPSRLPLSILDNPIYVRTFGDRNFEVIEKGDFLETRSEVFGRFYRFSKGDGLRIHEFKEDESEMLELLDGVKPNSWAIDLPKRLKNMHSHWLYRDSNLIVLRGISFNDRDVSFLIKLTANLGSNIEGKVKCVEVYNVDRDQLPSLMEEIPTMDTLVLQQSKALDVISKFERKEYIHLLIDAEQTLRFFCPRYELTFELNEGALFCKEIAGYQLGTSQQHDRTLRGINMYLLLEEVHGSGKMIIFPNGNVTRKLPGQISIEVKDDCDEQLMWNQCTYE